MTEQEESNLLYQQVIDEQMENIKSIHTLAIVEDELTARAGNTFHGSILWIDALPTDNLNFARGLPHVVVFPKSKESAEQWEKTGIGYVYSLIRDWEELCPTYELMSFPKMLPEELDPILDKEKPGWRDIHSRTKCKHA